MNLCKTKCWTHIYENVQVNLGQLFPNVNQRSRNALLNHFEKKHYQLIDNKNKQAIENSMMIENKFFI
jgi:hypothetical protein